MSKKQKLLARLATSPRDFTWDELETLMKGLGFEMKQGSGARAQFFHPNETCQVIQVHVPHGRNPKTLLVAVVNDIASRLRDWGYYDEE